MIFGPDIAAMRERAKAQVQDKYVRLGETDGTEPTLRAMYVLKVEQAKRVLAGQESMDRQIEREAEARGWTPFQMATVILYMASNSIELELERVAVNVKIEKAKTESEIVAVLAAESVAFAMPLPLHLNPF